MIKVIVADDHRFVRETVAKILDDEEDMKCVGAASSGSEAISMVKELQPDVAIIDVNMPGIDGIETTRQIKADFPQVSVLVLTAYDFEEYLLACLKAGADGFVLKTNLACDELAGAVRTVRKGRAVFDQDVVNSLRRLAERRTVKKGADGPEAELCVREKEILLLATQGMTSKEIAKSLCISELTVNTHFANIAKKLDARSRIEAVVKAIRMGLLSGVDLSNRDTEHGPM